MERSEIYARLTELIPELKRRDATARVMGELGVDDLLDQLIELNKRGESVIPDSLPDDFE